VYQNNDEFVAGLTGSVPAVLRFWQLKVYISQGSAATRFGCDEILDDSFIAYFPESVPVKEF